MSTEQQTHQYGPDRQRADIEAEAARAGLSLVGWVEEAISGANHDRAAENQFYVLARQHPGLNFLFSHPNRVGRHVEVTVGIARQLHHLGATVYIAGLGSLRDGRSWNYFLRDAIEAESDYTNVVSQLYRGKRGKALSGRWPHGAAPWGYELERDARGQSMLPRPHPDRAPAVRRVFELSETQGEPSVRATMKAEGWPSPSASGWSASTIATIVTNERYTGRAIFAGVQLDYPPIISQEQFERVQTARALRRHERGSRDTTLLLSGHLRCAVCGGAIGRMVGHTTKGERIYYYCWKSKKIGMQAGRTEPCSHNKCWVPDTLDALCWSALVRYLTEPAELRGIVAPPPTLADSPPPARVAELETAIARAWEPFAAGVTGYTLELAERIAAPFVAQLEALKAEYQPLPPPPLPNYDAQAARFAAMLQRALTWAQKRELMRLLDVRFYVGRDGLDHLTVTLPNE